VASNGDLNWGGLTVSAGETYDIVIDWAGDDPLWIHAVDVSITYPNNRPY